MIRPEQYLRPEIARHVQRLDLQARFIAEGFLSGLHAGAYRGFSVEFSEHRKYVPGDDPKKLDWAAWAKTDRLYVKTCRAETNLSAYLLVDTSLSMAFGGPPDTPTTPADGLTKLDYARSLAAAIGYLLVRQHDAVGLGLLGTDLQRLLPARSTKRQRVRVLSELALARGQGKTGLATAIHAVARRIRQRSLMLLISDLLDETGPTMQALRRLTFRGHDLIVFQVLDPMERRLNIEGPVILEDPETGRSVVTDADRIRTNYAGRIEAFVEDCRKGVTEAGGDFAVMTTSTPFDQALARFLRKRKRRF